MRLLVVTQYFWPEDFRINELVSQLSKRGHAITVLTGKPNYPAGTLFPEFQDNPREFEAYGGARIVRVPMMNRGKGKLSLLLNYISYALSASLFGPFLLRNEKFDAIFVFEPSPVTVGLPAIVLKYFKKCPIAFWVLDQWPETLGAIGIVKSSCLLKLIGELVSFIYRRCDLILSPSQSLIAPIQKYCRQESAQVVYFPNWVEDVYTKLIEEPAPEIPASENKFNILFAGNVGEAQDFPAILDTAEQLMVSHEDIRWLIIGDGRMSDWVNQEVNRRGLAEKFLLLGRFPMDKMPSFYKHADALFVSLKTSWIFSMTVPGKIQSYLSFGLPLIGMLDGEGAQIIEASGSGLVCSAGDSKKLAEIILKIKVMSPSERLEMGRNGKSYSEKQFDRDRLVQKLERLLQSL